MPVLEDFSSANVGYVVDLYEHFRTDPHAVDAATRAYFEGLSAQDRATLEGDVSDTSAARAKTPVAPAAGTAGVGQSSRVNAEDATRVVAAARLARGIREYGHLQAQTDPLGSPPPGDPMLDAATHGLTDDDLRRLPASIVWPDVDPGAGSCFDAIQRLRAIYTGPIGYDFDHVEDFAERAWLQGAVEAGTYSHALTDTERIALLHRLTQVEGFERFLQTTFAGQKRFSIEGTDALIPMLDQLIHDAAMAGTREVEIGMAHRGRLNVLAHILGKPYVTIFSEFHSAPNKELVPSEGSVGINFGWTGDVKYHLGAQRVVREGDLVHMRLALAHNPSHLEFVNPVVEGMARAVQDRRAHRGAPRQDQQIALALTIHGDAAFPGEGVVAETLNLSRLAGYQTGGTVHIIVNNQIGFTTDPGDARSTLYASDLAKGFEIPIMHVNADTVEACLTAIRLAYAYRQRFHKDVLVDLVGYRRWGHNEGDEPAFTQPRLYNRIASHPTARTLYAEQLERDGLYSHGDAAAMEQAVQQTLSSAFASLDTTPPTVEAGPLEDAPSVESVSTHVPAQTLRRLNDALLTWPADSTVSPKLERLLVRRRDRLSQPGGIDWAHAEALAFASLLADGVPIRLTGQDSERGTFSQRHLVLHDAHTDERHVPLQLLPDARASFAVYNSPLSEAAPLGFEYGYSVRAPEALVLWEAQFGDFANAAQVITDQFIAAARAKWRVHPSLVLLLPHGYEGQGPEHSSGRLERYLQLAAEDNVRIVQCTTAAQYFHVLRLQARFLPLAPRPLVLMTPKSLLRHPLATSSLDDLARGAFHPVLDDERHTKQRSRVRRLLLCSGKLAIELATAARDRPEEAAGVAIVRIEMLYPFPADALRRVTARYTHAEEVVWVQEEPRNMGAWRFVEPIVRTALPDHLPLTYVGRPERAATAEGLAELHAVQQAQIIEAVLPSVTETTSVAREEQHAG
jgi:2-oxoglutarate dehydrogenase E1 component